MVVGLRVTRHGKSFENQRGLVRVDVLNDFEDYQLARGFLPAGAVTVLIMVAYGRCLELVREVAASQRQRRRRTRAGREEGSDEQRKDHGHHGGLRSVGTATRRPHQSAGGLLGAASFLSAVAPCTRTDGTRCDAAALRRFLMKVHMDAIVSDIYMVGRSREKRPGSHM